MQALNPEMSREEMIKKDEALRQTVTKFLPDHEPTWFCFKRNQPSREKIMELWTDIPQLIWKTNFLMWMIYSLAVVLSTVYFIAEREKIFKVTSRKEMFADILFWTFIMPFMCTLGFGFALYGGIGLLFLVLEHS